MKSTWLLGIASCLLHYFLDLNKGVKYKKKLGHFKHKIKSVIMTSKPQPPHIKSVIVNFVSTLTPYLK